MTKSLPLLLYIQTGRGQWLIKRMAGWCARPGGIFLFVIPLAIALGTLRWIPASTDRTWADFFWFAIFFVAGYLIAADNRFVDIIKKQAWISLALWIVVFWSAGGLFVVVLGFDPSPGQGFSLLYIFWQIAWSIISWSAVVFMLSLGVRFLNFSNKALAYSNETVLPFFLLHQTVILIVGWFILPLDMSHLMKFLFIAVVSFALIIAL